MNELAALVVGWNSKTFEKCEVSTKRVFDWKEYLTFEKGLLYKSKLCTFQTRMGKCVVCNWLHLQYRRVTLSKYLQTST